MPDYSTLNSKNLRHKTITGTDLEHTYYVRHILSSTVQLTSYTPDREVMTSTLPGSPPRSPPTSERGASVTIPSDLTAWFEDPDSTEHTLIQPLSDIRAILTYFTNRFQVQALEVPLEDHLIPSLLAQTNKFITLLSNATTTLHHEDLLNWFVEQPWESNKVTFGNAWTAAKYMRLDLSYIIQMIDERLETLKGDEGSLALARELRGMLKNANETTYMAYQTMNEHLKSLRKVFPEAFDIEEEDPTDPFWGQTDEQETAG